MALLGKIWEQSAWKRIILAAEHYVPAGGLWQRSRNWSFTGSSSDFKVGSDDREPSCISHPSSFWQHLRRFGIFKQTRSWKDLRCMKLRLFFHHIPCSGIFWPFTLTLSEKSKCLWLLASRCWMCLLTALYGATWLLPCVSCHVMQCRKCFGAKGQGFSFTHWY